jgi:hypothetical protein
MIGSSAIEGTGIDRGSSHTSLTHLLTVLIALWLPTALLGVFILINQGPSPLNGPREALEAGGQNAEPRGDLAAVLTVPASSLMQIGVLLWGGRLLWAEYTRHKSRHRRRRRKFVDKILQRTTTVLIGISLVVTPPVFVWCLARFYKLCLFTTSPYGF